MQTDLFTPIISLYIKRKRIVTVSFLILMIVALLIIKAEYASLIYCGSTYGMPALVAKGSVENLYLGSSMLILLRTIKTTAIFWLITATSPYQN